jgi:hypothetical protein
MKFDYGDIVSIKSTAPIKYRPDNIGWICGITKIDSEFLINEYKLELNDYVYLVEYEDGSSNTIPELFIDYKFTPFEGLVEMFKDNLTLRIPLEEGGNKLVPFARRIGEVDDEYLNIIIPPWLAEKLNIKEGSLVLVDNQNNKLNFTRSDANDSSR